MASKHVDAQLDSASEAPFRLMALPDELWSRIARSAVTFDPPIKITSLHFPQWHAAAIDDKQKLVQPPITRVSRLLREETLPAFYTNTFVCYEVPYACAFIHWLWSIPSAISCVDEMSIIYLTRLRNTYDLSKRTLEASGFDVVETGEEIVEGYRRFKVVRKG
ncbi:hypothetical protein LTR17_010728 [Elasticomyces elasticus]|nr:hypothetical protein LTR17_010728 [Elasticomyces elasticus]